MVLSLAVHFKPIVTLVVGWWHLLTPKWRNFAVQRTLDNTEPSQNYYA
jgi:hypothetical protein